MTCYIVYYQLIYYSGYVNDKVFREEESAQRYVEQQQEKFNDRIWNYEPSLLG